MLLCYSVIFRKCMYIDLCIFTHFWTNFYVNCYVCHYNSILSTVTFSFFVIKLVTFDIMKFWELKLIGTFCITEMTQKLYEKLMNTNIIYAGLIQILLTFICSFFFPIRIHITVKDASIINMRQSDCLLFIL